MKKFIVLSLLALSTVPSAFAAKLQCDKPMRKLPASSELRPVIERAAQSYRKFSSSIERKQGAAYNVILLQRCTDRAETIQAFRANFLMRAGVRGTPSKIYTCETRQKRLRSESGRWGAWITTDTRCRPNYSSGGAPSYGDADDRDHHRDPNRPGVDPDDLYDPEFPARDSSRGGPDAVEDHHRGDGSEGAPWFSEGSNPEEF